ncbi:hypothetical protein Tco_0219353 [Tanacetum coccineum]
MKRWEEIIQENVFGLGGNWDHLPACLAHMLYCIITEKPCNLAYFIAKRIEFVRSQPKLNLPYGMLLTHLFNHVMGMYPHLVGDQYDIVDRVMLPLAVEQPQKVKKDVNIKRSRHSTSSFFAFHHGSSSHQNDDEEELRDEATLELILRNHFGISLSHT